eukprot:CAMPEP_0206017124 /NCGR_PEP_ID=MMETSP1464-20131121/24317_1 /ASSEMBLY_ACC=CAM_ASM_001124 /TAXON_ID=119497 /ORGANISM="Exanthemachrysis gayraliae, Strain RCC1523" /LENGTH=483 /DNA_ID=CAMNT_0053390955 /DNA_START=23 /DNA_END=1474 /DNA_ORIENTATION=+
MPFKGFSSPVSSPRSPRPSAHIRMNNDRKGATLERAEEASAAPVPPAGWPAAADGDAAQGEPPSVFGASALIAGTTVGAGILALPVTTLPVGFVPSTAALLLSWVFMCVSGLLIAEVTVNTICALQRPGLGLLATSEQVLGRAGSRVAGGAYVFIHYALLVAYCAQGGANAVSLLGDLPGVGGAVEALAGERQVFGPALFSLLLGGLIGLGDASFLENVNSAFVVLVVASFAGLLAVGIPSVDPSFLLAQADWPRSFEALPICILALVYHNVVPIVCTQLRGDMGKIRTAVVAGSAVPLAMFIAWNACVLGNVDPSAAAGGAQIDPMAVLAARADSAGASWTSAALGSLVPVFSEAAIVTSFFGFVYGLYDFLTDALGVRPGDKSKDALIYPLILAPPLVVVAVNPDIFLNALDTAGTFGVTTLFGLLPAAMAWRQRAAGEAGDGKKLAVPPVVPGGQVTLSIMALISLVIIVEGAADLAGLI